MTCLRKLQEHSEDSKGEIEVMGDPIVQYCLVVSTYPSEKYEFVNGKDDIPYIIKHEKCSKPPTRISHHASLSYT
jgi:hypothetical protein